MRSLRLVSIIVIASVSLLFGCSDKSVDQGEFPPEKKATAVVNGTEYRMEKGNFQWVRKKGLETESIQTDHASPNQMAVQLKPILVKPDQKVKVKIEDDPVIKVYLWNETGIESEIKLEDNQINMPADKGKYIYEVLAEWQNGEISFTFVAEVQ
ncbi:MULTISPECIES: hypothetical protein [unclassified Cytobacillus]|uniref:hypothetical protein n=1 Tax=unclassified Cytobacillus TaxID=2675268 RepID=UPI001358B012|nr:hypothetical protein [Cytobacillus sp. AMY 15.2]KAF0818224.1 hypothetical protein KIS4809_3026 [Bacillus sp. ZZV12-4809]MCM3093632.1 hypothetical protein [Cytobacillus sp. AMY 15.2]